MPSQMEVAPQCTQNLYYKVDGGTGQILLGRTQNSQNPGITKICPPHPSPSIFFSSFCGEKSVSLWGESDPGLWTKLDLKGSRM